MINYRILQILEILRMDAKKIEYLNQNFSVSPKELSLFN